MSVDVSGWRAIAAKTIADVIKRAGTEDEKALEKQKALAASYKSDGDFFVDILPALKDGDS